MTTFGETIRNLRAAQELGLREAAVKVGISPAYLSRIERGKESPPRPDIIKSLAKILAADPDVLFRLSSCTDPEIVNYLHDNPDVLKLIRLIKSASLSNHQINSLLKIAEEMISS